MSTTPAIRKYNIAINISSKASQMADDILLNFDCAVSEPSVWLEDGTTTAKGLSFLHKSGKSLQSSLFRDQAFFTQESEESEETAIASLVYATIFDHYHFGRQDLDVRVKKYQ